MAFSFFLSLCLSTTCNYLLAKRVDSETMLRGSLLAHCKEVVTVAVV